MATRSVGTGKDYATLNLWYASLPSTLMEIEVAECYGSVGPMALTSAKTGTESSYIIVRAATGEGHSGVWDSSKARASRTDGYPNQLSSNYARIIGMQIDSVITANSKSVLVVGAYQTIDRCIVRPVSLGTYTGCRGLAADSNFTANISNCIVYGFNTASSIGINEAGYGSANMYVYNNTFYNCTTGLKRSSGCPVVAKNNLAQNCTDGFSGTFATGSDKNCSSIASDAPGTNPVTGTVSFVDAANFDFHLSASDTVARGQGADLSADAGYPITIDVDGETISTWSIGADSVASAGGEAITGTLSSTLDGCTLSAAGSVETPLTEITGSLASTLDAVSLSASGDVVTVLEEITGGLTDTLGDVSISAAGSVDDEPPVLGSLSTTLADLSAVATGEVTGEPTPITDIWAVDLSTYAEGTAGWALHALASALLGNVAGGMDAAEVLHVLAAVAMGKAHGGGTGQITFRDLSDTRDIVSMTVDSNGNRTDVVVS